MKRMILIADDVEENRKELKEVLNKKYTILEAKNGEQAINYLEEFDGHLLLAFVDFVMPKKSGLQVVEYMIKKNIIKETPVIMISGDESIEEGRKAFELGVFDCVSKPFNEKAIDRKVKNIASIFDTREEYNQEVERRTEEFAVHQKKLERSNDILAKNNAFLVRVLSSVVEFRSLHSTNHIGRIKKITKIMLNQLKELYPDKYGLTDENIELMVEASALHDLGKIAIPDNILMKPGKLDDREFEEVKMHTMYGCDILERFKEEDSDFYRYCYDICRSHHERVDGNGYPDGLMDDEIPIWAQVVGIADVFDALVSPRVYKEAYEQNIAIAMIYNGECGKFSDEIMKAFDKAQSQIFATIDETF